ncbi:MAG: FkbM family methyltransferase [Anaerolineales bacterium]|nr:FkbM family methyltransferase [Anaerolineales bacterium]
MIALYRWLFARPSCAWLNRFVTSLGLHGLGILNYENEHVSGEAYFLRWLVRRYSAPVVLDIGANVGNYASRIKTLSPQAVIYAFEPHPRTFAVLAAEAERHGFTALNVGCGDAAGQAQLFDYAASDAGSSHASLYRDVIERIHRSASVAWPVTITTIDRFLQEVGLTHVDLIKIDTEGHELAVLQGARQAIAAGQIDIVQFEFNEMNISSRVFFRDLCDVLPGYVFYRLLPSGFLPLRDYRPIFWEIFAFQNIVAVRTEVSMRLGLA